ncbi:MAG: hypothetical protein ACXWW5_02600 [Actinomycetota bacterium]
MRSRLGRLLLVAVVVCSAFLASAPSATSAQRHTERRTGPCGLSRGAEETLRQLSKRHIRCAVDEFGPVPGGARRAICIARRESDLIPTARSATSQYLGLYQHAADYWPDRYDTWTEPVWGLSPSALRGRTNAIVTIRMVAEFGRWKLAGWPRHDC